MFNFVESYDLTSLNASHFDELNNCRKNREKYRVYALMWRKHQKIRNFAPMF